MHAKDLLASSLFSGFMFNKVYYKITTNLFKYFKNLVINLYPFTILKLYIATDKSSIYND